MERRLRLATAQRHRLNAQKARIDMRDWAKARRERTRHLIELGGLVQKAGLVELVDDDRATLLGAFLEIADRLRGLDDADVDPHHLATHWRRRGLKAFDVDKESAAATGRREDGQLEEDART